MFGSLEIFKLASGLAWHSATRQSLVAQNIANADTPGYRARDIGSFASAVTSVGFGEDQGIMRTSHPGHVDRADWQRRSDTHAVELGGNASPNGNSVSLESEMVKATHVKHRHDLALATYRGGLDLLRTAIGAGR